MAYRVEVAARARRDLDALYEAIHVEESGHAFNWFNGLAEAMRSLANMPYRAPMIHEDSALRHLLYGKRPHVYRIIYRVDESIQTVRIIHVRHGTRRPLRTK